MLCVCIILLHVHDTVQLCFFLQSGSIMAARWPVLDGEVSETLLKEADYLLTVSHEFRVRLKKIMDMRGKVCPWLKCIYI